MTAAAALTRPATRSVTEIRDDIDCAEVALRALRIEQEAWTGHDRFDFGVEIRRVEERVAALRAEIAKAEALL